MRKQYFNDEEKGYFKSEKRDSAPPNPMSGTRLEFMHTECLHYNKMLCLRFMTCTECTMLPYIK